MASVGSTKSSPRLDWDFSTSDKTDTVAVEGGSDLFFHRSFSSGTAILKGGVPLERGHHHYWELEMKSPIYGSAVMVGLGTNDATVHAFTDVFAPAIGIDKHSWGYSHLGHIHHDCGFQDRIPDRTLIRPKKYASDKTWKEGSIIGVYFDSWRGHVEFYLNRTPLGIAFTGLPRDTDVFPMVCATSAKTKMELICSQRFRAGLAFDCARILCKPQEAEQIYTEPYLEYTVPYLLYAKNNRFQYNLLMNKRHVAKWTKTLPPLLWRFINDNCWYLIGCKLQDLENDPDLNQRHLTDHLTSTMEVVSSDEEESPSYPYHKQLSQQRTMPTAEQSQDPSSSSSEEEEEEGFTLTAGPSCTIRTAAVEDASSEEDNITLYSSTHRTLKDSWTIDSDVKRQHKKRLRIQRKVEDHAPQASSSSITTTSGGGSSKGKLPLRYNMGKGAKGKK